MTDFGVRPEFRLAVSQRWAPPDFRFPASYVQLITSGELPDASPIFWLLHLETGIEEWTGILQSQYPDRALVPIAKDRRTDDVFCFDGADLSGEPAVMLIHSFTEPGWEYRGEWLTFDSWYAGLIEFHQEWERSGEAEWADE